MRSGDAVGEIGFRAYGCYAAPPHHALWRDRRGITWSNAAPPLRWTLLSRSLAFAVFASAEASDPTWPTVATDSA
jgi:hypothetical protein